MTYKVETLKTKSLTPYARNARTHSEDQVSQIASSIEKFGFNNPVLIDNDNGIIAGHGRVMAADVLGLQEIPCIRLKHLTDEQKRAYILADNQIALNAGWNDELLKLELTELFDLNVSLDDLGFSADELKDTLGFNPTGETDEELAEKYTALVKSPHYQITYCKPEISQLFDMTKANNLIQEIEESGIADEEKDFLIAAAQRHIVFDYHQIAEFYAHASAETQDLMEKSALVIIDFKKAIAEGFVKLTNKLNDLYESD